MLGTDGLVVIKADMILLQLGQYLLPQDTSKLFLLLQHHVLYDLYEVFGIFFPQSGLLGFYAGESKDGRHTDPKEFIEIGGKNRQEGDAVVQRNGSVGGLLQYPVVKTKPAEVPV